jgi:hypothetical protein
MISKVPVETARTVRPVDRSMTWVQDTLERQRGRRHAGRGSAGACESAASRHRATRSQQALL